MDIAHLAILGWIPVAAFLFAFMRPVRALVLAYLIGWLALPVAAIEVRGFWDVDKVLATNAGVMLGSLVFCLRQFRGYKFGLADLLLLAFAGGTCVTSVLNGLGVYDGVSSITHKLLYFGVPFWFGRAFIKSHRDLLEAARTIVCASAVYALFTVWEWRMSPQVHNTLYGYFQHSWNQHVRWGFYRPIVCFPHALGLGTFMSWTSLLALWLHRARQLRPVFGVPPVVLVALPMLGLLASMSLGPWMLFLAGCALMYFWRQPRRRRLIWIPAAFTLLWMAGRYTGAMQGEWLLSPVTSISQERAASLEYRVNAERILLEKARQRPVFGWGTWGRNRVTDENGRDLVATDSIWIIYVGAYGLFGLSSFFLWWCSPYLLSRRVGSVLEATPAVAVLLVAIGLQAVNFLFNGFLSPVLTLMNGAVVTALLLMKAASRSAPRQATVRAPLAPRARQWGPAS